MNKFGGLALGAVLLTSACSGHSGTSSMLPNAGGAPSQPSSLGTRNTRPSALMMAPPGWAPTATQALSLANATDLGAVSPDKVITVRLGLQMRNPDGLKAALTPKRRVSSTEFMSNYAPTSAQVASVTNYLQSQGFTGIQVEPNNLLISANAPVATVSKAFHTKLESFAQNSLNVYANVEPAFVPQELNGIVVGVLGLNNAVRMTTPKLTAPYTASASANVTNCTAGSKLPGGIICHRWYDPATFNITYDAGNTPDASNSSIAIMASGDTKPAVAWWRINEAKYNMPAVPLTTVLVGPPSPENPGGTGEWNLDLTYSQAMTGYNVGQMYIYQNTSLTDSDIALEYNRWVTDNKAVVGNSSFGGCEYGPYLDGSMLIMDSILAQGASQGQTMFVSTGDSGSFCSVGVPNGVPAGAPLAEYPAASPYVVAVGGTDLFSDANGSSTYQGETAWEAGGGGLSQFEYSPYWETPAQPHNASSSVPASLRGLPDVAYDASLETGALIHEGTSAEYFTGGTSLSSPMMAGVYARLQSASGNTLGFAPPLLYKIFYGSTAEDPLTEPTLPGVPLVPRLPATRYVGPYHDILSGANGLYQALPNYDYTTGLGSVDIHRMYNAVRGVPLAQP